MIDGTGIEFEYRGQAYRLVRRRTHVSDNGRQTEVLDWETICPDCGANFEIFTRLRVKAPTRRCAACAKPGVRVPSRDKP